MPNASHPAHRMRTSTWFPSACTRTSVPVSPQNKPQNPAMVRHGLTCPTKHAVTTTSKIRGDRISSGIYSRIRGTHNLTLRLRQCGLCTCTTAKFGIIALSPRYRLDALGYRLLFIPSSARIASVASISPRASFSSTSARAGAGFVSTNSRLPAIRVRRALMVG